MSCKRTKYGFRRQKMSKKNMLKLWRMTVCVHDIVFTRRKRNRRENMDKSSDAKSERVLSIYSRLRQGKVIYKAEESLHFDVAQRTIQRDIADIQCFLNNQNSETGEIQEIVFDRKSGGYRLETKLQKCLEGSELLAVCKVLLESRSLVKEEMFPIINKLINTCSDEKQKKLVKEYISNEMHHYIELQHHEKLLNKLWLLESTIRKQSYIEVLYQRASDKRMVKRQLKPVGIMFSEFYFYLTAYIEDIDKDKHFENPDDSFPTIYRVDRIQDIQVLNEHFKVPYAERFEEGEFRKRVQFMYGGRLRKVKLRCKESGIQAVLDRLPTAEIVEKTEAEYIVKAEVFGDGIDMWIGSQGKSVEMIK